MSSSPSSDASLLWSKSTWTPIYSPDTSPSSTLLIGYHKQSVPYLSSELHHHHPLQTLSVWIPPPFHSDEPNSSPTPPPPNYIPSSRKTTWIVYIHGGAWRDPKIDASSFHSTALSLLSSSSPSSSDKSISGIISLNYRLSAHPSSFSPSSSSDFQNNAKHPDHISDILSAFSFLEELGIEPTVTVGHSCGATLAFESVMDPARWGLSSERNTTNKKPDVIVGVNGLYDLEGFIKNPPAGYESLQKPYEEFVKGAFGEDEKVWRDVCPASCQGNWGKEWNGDDNNNNKQKKKVVLVQSREDGLVPYEQLEGLKRRIVEKEEGVIEVEEVDGTGWGQHDDAWKRGDKLAEVLRGVLGGL
ncbi:Alpha/Beta hydrolase protein, partial [Cladorrhinum sp. PSN259]